MVQYKDPYTRFLLPAGWKIPVVTLLRAGLLKKGECDFAGQIGRFFTDSCAPGSKDPTYDPNGTNPPSLCNLCVGNDGVYSAFLPQI